MTDRKLKKPARIGGTIFHVGVSERLVVQRAQREYELWEEEAPKVNDLVEQVRAILAKKKQLKERRSAAPSASSKEKT